MKVLRVGVCGWSHADWVGPFYPVQLRARPEAWLGHYANRFRTVEVTSTFDALPDEALVEAWSREGARLQDRGPFEFSLKLPRRITHEALPAGDLALVREETGRFDREVLDPLDGEGLLGAVLVQLPPRVVATHAAVTALLEIIGALAERSVALDLRHPSWVANGCVVPMAERLFASRDVCLVESDMPGAPDVRPPIDARHAYFRFHGRNRERWIAPDGAHDPLRYDHLYTQDELAPWVARAKQLDDSRPLRAYFHNTPGAKCVANAMEFRELCGAAGPGPRPRITEQKRLPV